MGFPKKAKTAHPEEPIFSGPYFPKKTPWWKSPWPYILLAVLLLFLLLRQCGETRHIEASRENLADWLTDTISHYENEKGQIVAEKNALRGDLSNLELFLTRQSAQLEKLQEKYRKANTAGEIKTVVEIDSIPIPYPVPVEADFFRVWSKFDKYYEISGTSTEQGITIDSLSIPNTLSFVIGEKKGKYTITAVNSNPFIKTTGLEAYTFDPKKKRFGLSIYAGYGLSENFTFSPSIGVALTWDLLRF